MSTCQYKVESYFKGDPQNTTGPRCQFNRYIVEIYLESGKASTGEFKLRHPAQVLYYLGHVPIDGITATVLPTTHQKRVNGTLPMPKENPTNDPFYGYDIFKTTDITVEWSSDTVVDACTERKKIAKLMFCVGRWEMGYADLTPFSPAERITPDESFVATANGVPVTVSENHDLGVVPPDASQLPPPFRAETDKGALLARFAVLADAHVGVRYNWENYDWLHGAFENLARIHRETPLDFVVQLGDNIDDGYAKTYRPDYETYLEEIKHLTICDPINPIDGRAADKIPHYEMQGNHDTSFDTRFFRTKLWYTQNANGEKVAYIAFFASYGGYPLVNFNVAGNGNSYRSYGILSDEVVAFTEASILQAKRENAKHIILLSHFGLSQDVGAPVLPESGLGKIALLCRKYNIKLSFNGHEHDESFTHRMFEQMHDFDVSMLHDKYAIVEVYDRAAKITVINTADSAICREEYVAL